RPGRAGAWHGREAPAACRGHHQLDDAGRARAPRDHQGVAEKTDRRGSRRSGSGSEPPAQPVRADAEDDEDDEGRKPPAHDARHEGLHAGDEVITGMTRSLALAAGVAALALSGPGFAQDASATRYGVPGHGSLELKVPGGWRSQTRSRSDPPMAQL